MQKYAEMSPDKNILMQSTGLKDKNGVEIFEGDIVAIENHPFQRKEDSGTGMEIEGDYVVGWNQYDLTWCAGDLLLARLKPYVRIIGNIYENIDLVEVE
ncbi:YopX family protein [Enterococcus hirae]